MPENDHTSPRMVTLHIDEKGNSSRFPIQFPAEIIQFPAEIIRKQVATKALTKGMGEFNIATVTGPAHTVSNTYDPDRMAGFS